jgi:hypothetical protein
MSNTDSDESNNLKKGARVIPDKKPRKPRPPIIPKAKRFTEEKNKIRQKFDKILGISADNDRFYMCDIDENKQKQIEDTLEDIKKYYQCSESRWYKEPVNRLFLALIRFVYKNAKVELLHTQKTVERNGVKLTTGMYVVVCG